MKIEKLKSRTTTERVTGTEDLKNCIEVDNILNCYRK